MRNTIKVSLKKKVTGKYKVKFCNCKYFAVVGCRRAAAEVGGTATFPNFIL